MILLVAADGTAGDVAPALPDQDWERIEPTGVVGRLADDAVDVVVIDRTSMGEAADRLVERLRSPDVEATVPVVVVASGDVSHLPLLRFDEVVRPPVERSLSDAVARALSVSEYRDAVTELYERCQEHAESDAERPGETEDLQAVRERADELLGDLVDRDPGLVADLLRVPDGEDDA